MSARLTEHDTKSRAALTYAGGWFRALALPDAGYLWGLLAVLSPSEALSAATVSIVAVGWAGFMLERAKASRALLDPADAAADPARHAVLRRHGCALRLAALLTVMGGAVSLAFVGNGLERLLPLGVLGVLLYGHRFQRTRTQQSARPKDVFLLKNTAVVLAYAGVIFATGTTELSVLAWVCITVGFDTILCDIPDADADRRFGTRTLSVVLGPGASKTAACLAHAAAAVYSIASGLPVPLVIVSITGVVAALLPRVTKEFVDLRLPAIAMLVLFMHEATTP